MKEVLEHAEQLADALSRSERYRNLREAEKSVEENTEAKALLEEYNRVTMVLLEKQQALKPIEPEEKRSLAAIKEKVAVDPVLTRLNKAQADYSEMMNKVNHILFEKLEVRPA